MVNPRDADIPFSYGHTGDIATVEGKEFYYNHALHLALIAVGGLSGSGLTSSDIRSAESRIQTEIIESPFFERPVSVEVVSDEDRETFRAQVNISNFDETITLPLEDV